MGCTRSARTTMQELNIDWKKAMKELNKNCTFIEFDSERSFKILMVPEESSLWYGGKYVFTFTIPDLYPDRNIIIRCMSNV